MEKRQNKFFSAISEWFRKLMVSLKRTPQNIIFVMLIVCFVEYSLRLTNISNTTAYINVTPMGLCEFVTMLVSVLAVVVFLNIFPKRAKVNIPMLILFALMLAIMVACDVLYCSCIDTAIAKDPTSAQDYVMAARSQVITHIVLVAVTGLLLATLPLYSALLKKIKTSIELEYTDTNQTVELAED